MLATVVLSIWTRQGFGVEVGVDFANTAHV